MNKSSLALTTPIAQQRSRYTVVLDDDPTGAQESSGVPMLLVPNRERLFELLEEHHTVFVLTNSRALDQQSARELLRRLRDDIEDARQRLGQPVLIVQRGDSTLRGHVFAEIDVFAQPDSIVIFAPAFPAGGRQTVGGVQLVRIGTTWQNVADTEFARDPHFGFTSRELVGFVKEKGTRAAMSVSTELIEVAAASARAGTVIVPDASSDDDIRSVAEQVLRLVDAGHHVVVRGAAPLAAYLSGSKTPRLLAAVPTDRPTPVLIVVGSHTAATTQQVERLTARWNETVELSTRAAIDDPDAAARDAAERVTAALSRSAVVTLSTERERLPEHRTELAGARVMTALAGVVALVREVPGVTISKGGITSAEVARVGFGASECWVEGQLAPGVSVVTMLTATARRPLVMVPGNVGDPDTIVRIVAGLVHR